MPGGLDRRICAPAKWRSAPARRAALCRSHRRRARGACDHRSRYTDRPAGAGGPRRADRRQRGALAPRRTQIVGVFGPFTPRRICRSWPFRRSAIEIRSAPASMRGRPGDFSSAKEHHHFCFRHFFQDSRGGRGPTERSGARRPGARNASRACILAPQWRVPAGISEEDQSGPCVTSAVADRSGSCAGDGERRAAQGRWPRRPPRRACLCRDRGAHTPRLGAALSRFARARRVRSADGDLGVGACVPGVLLRC